MYITSFLSINLSVDTGFPHVLTSANNSAVNMGMPISFQDSDFDSFKSFFKTQLLKKIAWNCTTVMQDFKTGEIKNEVCL